MIHADRSYPVINVPSESITVSVKGGDAAILEGVTVSDASDGDLTDQLFIESRSTFNDDMRFTATIAVSDSANHITKVTREVEYSDYTSPQFELYKNEDGNFYSGEYTTGGEAIMIPPDFLSRSGKVDYNTPGVYEITYKYTDSDIDISNFSRLYVVVY